MRFLIFLVVLATFSCNPGKQLTKAEARLAQAGRLPAICSERFPVRDTTFIKDTLVKIDTFLSGEYIFDTLRVNDTLYQIEYKPLEIIKTKTLTNVVKVEDKAKIEGLVNPLETLNQTLQNTFNQLKSTFHSVYSIMVFSL